MQLRTWFPSGLCAVLLASGLYTTGCGSDGDNFDGVVLAPTQTVTANGSTFTATLSGSTTTIVADGTTVTLTSRPTTVTSTSTFTEPSIAPTTTGTVTQTTTATTITVSTTTSVTQAAAAAPVVDFQLNAVRTAPDTDPIAMLDDATVSDPSSTGIPSRLSGSYLLFTFEVEGSAPDFPILGGDLVSGSNGGVPFFSQDERTLMLLVNDNTTLTGLRDQIRAITASPTATTVPDQDYRFTMTVFNQVNDRTDLRDDRNYVYSPGVI